MEWMIPLFLIFAIAVIIYTVFFMDHEAYHKKQMGRAEQPKYRTVWQPSSWPLSSAKKRAGDKGEAIFRDVIHSLKGKKLHNYMYTNNLVVNGKNFEIDFIVLVPGVGIVLTEVKYYSGTVYCTGGEEWQQNKPNGDIKKHKNASKQVLRTKSLTSQVLKRHALNHWPIIPLVVFTHPDATIKQHTKGTLSQTDVIRSDMFAKWLDKQPKDAAIRFTQQDNNAIKKALATHAQRYEAA